jgi:hypothetical protein
LTGLAPSIAFSFPKQSFLLFLEWLVGMSISYVNTFPLFRSQGAMSGISFCDVVWETSEVFGFFTFGGYDITQYFR